MCVSFERSHLVITVVLIQHYNSCLTAVTPSNCPLCRKTFVPDRLKKLHVDRPPAFEQDLQEVELLQRLALVWESPEDQLVDMIDEVTGWLEDRQTDTVSFGFDCLGLCCPTHYLYVVCYGAVLIGL
jgi:hypothetical protein